ncbi:hypothetical protein PoB_001811700 [Plakobranchus ocellatus]|uniref:Uncharacterized protein n=1 Tax=Plakobranchus ocellatus TaxID=259542 RepID=A0AAV3ZAQ1_9GAST|nr:hypothetical protein PoB_001811700 [Plakobranchus ocellatus]
MIQIIGGSGGSSGRAGGYQCRGPGFESQSVPNQSIIAPPCPPSTKWESLSRLSDELAYFDRRLWQIALKAFRCVTPSLPKQKRQDVFLMVQWLVIPPCDMRGLFCRGFGFEPPTDALARASDGLSVRAVK